MTQNEIIDAWNKQADYMNKWDRLGEDEKLEWAMKLECEACAQIVNDDRGLSDDDAIRLCRAIRARRQP